MVRPNDDHRIAHSPLAIPRDVLCRREVHMVTKRTPVYKKARFKHDCNKCVYLGRFDQHKLGKFYRYDLYWCASEHENLSSLIARFGNDSPDYRSSHPPEAFCIDYEPPEIERVVLSRALATGLYQPWKRRKQLEGIIRLAISDLDADDAAVALSMLKSTNLG